jgi:hypothetical protein
MKEIITSNHIKGESVKTVEEVYNLALQKKGIYVSSWKRISPAGFLICWQACMLIDLIKKGYLFNITPIQKKADKKMWYQSTKV